MALPGCKPHKILSFFSLAFLLTALFASSGLAQSTFGEFTGTVKDPSGSVISGAVVKATNAGTSTARSVTSDAAGNYTLLNMEPGDYVITFEAPGFTVVKYEGLTLLTRQTIRQDVQFSLSKQSQTISVNEASEAPINTEVSNIAETKTGRELTDLPVAIYSRSTGSTSPISTLTTQPGVETDSSGALSIAGAKPSQLSVTLDGISTMSPRSSSPINELFPSFDSIAEIHVSEINNTAEFGGISDITTISKGGTNTYHGGAYDNNQVSRFDARSTFVAAIPKLVLNDFGGFLGGPVNAPKLYHGKDKTFFFMSYEGLRRPNKTTLTESVPTAAMRTGDLSVYLPKTIVKDPSNGGAPFAGNIIPPSRISPLSAAVLNFFYPLPNYGPAGAIGNNYQANFPTNITSDAGDMRIDQNITSKQTAFAAMTYKVRQSLTSPSATGSALLGGGTQIERDYGVHGAYNYVITPTIINELRLGYTGSNSGTGYGYTAAGVQQALNLQTPGTLPQGAASPSISITGFSGTSGGTTSISKTNTTQILDNVTFSKAKHTIKMGGDFRYLTALFTNVFASNRLGGYTFNNSVTSSLIGSPIGAFLLGIPDNSSGATVTSPDTDGYSHSLGFFVQDDWKITSRLTINYGIRYEYHPQFADHYNNTANFDPNYYSVQGGVTVHGAVIIPDKAVSLLNPGFVQSIAPTPILTATQAGVPQSLRFSQKTDFAPRVGFAWRLTDKTVIRGGYGKFIEAELGSGINASWAVEASDVGKFTNSQTNGKFLYNFPYALPSNLAQPGTEYFDLASDLHYKDPYVQQWNLTVERDLGFQTAVRVSYDGSHGTDLGLTTNPNQVPANTVGFATAKLSAPFPLLSQIAYLTNGGLSNYQSFTVTVNKRFSRGLQFQSSYNFAKNLSNEGGTAPSGFAGEGGGQPTDIYNLGLDYGNVAFTRRNRFQTTFLYNLPVRVSNKYVNQAVSGWELAGVLLFQSGPFLTATASGADPANINQPNLTGNGRTDVVSGVSPEASTPTSSQWLNPAAFAIPGANLGRFGNEPIGYVIGPGTQAVSLSLFRTITVKERMHVRVGMSVANAFNHPNYSTPSLTLGTSTFGTITSLQTAEGAGPRQIQLTGRITF